MSVSALHEIVAIPGRGNALVATRLILKGELIFTEKPSIWHSQSKSEGFCSSCGKLIPLSNRENGHDTVSVLLPVIRSSSSEKCNTATERTTSNSGSGIGTRDSHDRNCGKLSYCDTVCRDKADIDGQGWFYGDASEDRYKVREPYFVHTMSYF